MRKATQEEIDKCNASGDELNMFALRNAMLNGKYNPNDADRKALKKLAFKHYSTQKHHPEAWDEKFTENNSEISL